MAPTLPGSSWAENSGDKKKKCGITLCFIRFYSEILRCCFNIKNLQWVSIFQCLQSWHNLYKQLSNFHLSLTNLPCASGSSHRQHLSLFQVQADVFEDRCDVEVSEEEPRVTVQVSVRFVLLLDLLKQLSNALQKILKPVTPRRNDHQRWHKLCIHMLLRWFQPETNLKLKDTAT